MVDFPIIQFYEFDVAEIADPAGTRHIEGGSFAFRQRLALGCQTYTGVGTSGTLIFEDVKINASESHVESKVAAVIARLATSGIIMTNMRLYLFDDSVVQASKDQGLDPILVQFAVSGIWQPNGLLPSGAGQSLSTTPPASPNVFRQDGVNLINGEQDADVSQYMYINIAVPNGTPLGNFGACGSGLLTFGFLYDFYNDN